MNEEYPKGLIGVSRDGQEQVRVVTLADTAHIETTGGRILVNGTGIGWAESGMVLGTGIKHVQFLPRVYSASATSGPGGWNKCPFCGRSQHADREGPTCRACGGNLFAEGVQ